VVERDRFRVSCDEPVIGVVLEGGKVILKAFPPVGFLAIYLVRGMIRVRRLPPVSNVLEKFGKHAPPVR
jgi:hypothetical protein